jgi:hypothetical protein
MQGSADPGPPPPQQPPADDGAATMMGTTGGETPELEADVPLANHATLIAAQPSPSAYGPQAPQGFLALQPTQAAGHGEIHPHRENEQPNLLNPAPVVPRKSRSRRQPASAQPKLTRLQARAGKRKRHHVLEDTSDEDVPSDSNSE